MSVTVITMPNCSACKASIRVLDKLGVQYNKVDITENPDLLDQIKSLGHVQAPVIIAGDDSWSGFRPDRIRELVAA